MNTRLPNAPPEVSADDLRFLAASLRGWTMEVLGDIERRYNPHQPRVPAGHANGGQWTDGGGGKPLLQDAMARIRPGSRGALDETIESLLEGGTPRGFGSGGGGRRNAQEMPRIPQANRAAGKIKELDKKGAEDLQEVLVSRAQRQISPKESDNRIRQSADEIEKFFGGKIEAKDVRINSKGDLVIFKENKKFRLDVQDPGNWKGRKDDPHFHFQQINESGRWVDATDLHRNYFIKD
ncbi:MAG: hypothetical protein Q8K65_00440 [Alphaproteobacteria bacterium]|nr:hypothetical protein [Alphaproteobacteria bacterium]